MGRPPMELKQCQTANESETLHGELLGVRVEYEMVIIIGDLVAIFIATLSPLRVLPWRYSWSWPAKKIPKKAQNETSTASLGLWRLEGRKKTREHDKIEFK